VSGTRDQESACLTPDACFLTPEWRDQVSGTRDQESACLTPDTCFLTPEWWAREDLNLRPHAYQARALTS
jgi:hypothetical protein